MYRIDPTPFGYQLTFSGLILEAEMREWVQASAKVLVTAPKAFGVLVDMRDLQPLGATVGPVMEAGQKLYKQAGMERSAVILKSATVTMQFRRLARQSGIDAFERYLNAAERRDWETAATAWLTSAVDPDRVTA